VALGLAPLQEMCSGDGARRVRAPTAAPRGRQLDARRCKGEVDYTETNEKEKVDFGELIDERQIAFRARPPPRPFPRIQA